MRIEISHDILARKVFEKADAADRAFLRAQLLVQERCRAFKDTRSYLNANELHFIAPHRSALETVLTKDQIRFIARSERARHQWQIWTMAVGTIVIISLIGSLIYYTNLNDKIQDNAYANAYLSLSLEYFESNPTKALQLAQEAAKISKGSWSSQQLLNLIYRNNYFYQQTFEHHERIYATACNPKRNLIATAGSNSMVYIWNYHGIILDTLKAHQDKIYTLAFSPDGNQLISGSDDDTVILWNWQKSDQKFMLRKRLKHPKDINEVAFSPDGQYIAAGCKDRQVYLWSIEGELLKRLYGHRGNIYALAFSQHFDKNKWMIASGGSDPTGGRLVVWKNLFKNKIDTLQYTHPNTVTSVRFTIEKTNDQEKLWLATGCRDFNARLLEIYNKKIQLKHIFEGHMGSVRDVQFAPNSKKLLTSSWDNTAKLWDYEHFVLLETLTGHNDRLYKAAFSPHGDSVITTSSDGMAHLWNLTLKSNLRTYGTHSCHIQSLDISKKNKYIVTASRDSIVHISHFKTGKSLSSIRVAGDVEAIRFFPNQNYIILASGPKLFVYNFKGNQKMAVLAHEKTIKTIALSKDGTSIITGGRDQKAILWEIFEETDGTFAIDSVQQYDLSPFLRRNKRGDVHAVAFSPDETLIATASEDGVVRIWETDNPIPVQELSRETEVLYAIAFTPDNQHILAGGSDKMVHLWALDLEENNDDDINYSEHSNIKDFELMTFSGHQESIRSLDISSDGKTVMSTSEDGSIKLWDIHGGLTQTIQVNRGTDCNSPSCKGVFCAKFTSNENYIVSGSGNGNAYLFYTPRGALSSNKIQRLTTAEFKQYRSKIEQLVFSDKKKNTLKVGGER